MKPSATHVVPVSKVARRDYGPAARCRIDFDALARRLGAQSNEDKLGGRGEDAGSYKDIWLALMSGRFASLTQTSLRRAVVEIGLEILEDEFFYEQDLDEAVALLGIDPNHVERMRGEFTWLPDAAKAGKDTCA